jgi:3-hydroxyisobutyrate dehydrogenase
MAVHDLAPGFYVEHYVKDLGIALREAKRMSLNLPGLEMALSFFRRVEELGHGRSGHQALILALEELSKVDISK